MHGGRGGDEELRRAAAESDKAAAEAARGAMIWRERMRKEGRASGPAAPFPPRPSVRFAVEEAPPRPA